MEIKRFALKKHLDKRGLLVQNDYEFLAKKMKHFLVSFSKPGIVRGNHYHQRKREWFYVIKGKMKLSLVDLKTQEKKTLIIDAKKPELVEIEPNMAHATENIGKEELIFLGIVNEKFQEDDPDTYFFKLK